jgi:cytochrome c553
MKKNIMFLLTILGILLILFAVSRKEFPAVPDDPDHASSSDIRSCNECHGPEGKHAMKESHPPKYECFKCHKPLIEDE